MSNGLDVALMKDPFGEWAPENGDRHTDIAFAHDEWESFFFDTLRAERLPREYGVKYDDEFNARDHETWKESLNAYPLLARSHDFYRDASFAPDEVVVLREELNRAKDLPLTDKGNAFLQGMIAACDMAHTSNLGIILLSS